MSLGSVAREKNRPGGAEVAARSGGPAVVGAAGGPLIDETGSAEGGAQTHTHGRLSATTVGAVTGAAGEQLIASASNACPGNNGRTRTPMPVA